LLLNPGRFRFRLSSWDWPLVQSSLSDEVSPVLVKRSHFAVSRFAGFVVFPRSVSSGHRSVSRSSPLFEFCLPIESYPAKPSLSAEADQLLSWALFPYSTSRIGGPHDAGLPTCSVPSSGFGYPLDGFLPTIPCRFSFAPAALLGFTLRSFLLPKGIRGLNPE
jgi:hypothetical protein